MFEDPVHPARRFGIDLQRMTMLAGDRAIAVRKTAGVVAALDLARETAMGLGAQVIEVNLVDRPRMPRVSLRDAPEFVS